MVLPEVGAKGQEMISKARVAIIGCGGLGSPVAAYLAGAGVGFIKLVDADAIHNSNLHRQVFFITDSRLSKVEALQSHITDLNPHIIVEAVPQYLNRQNISDLISNVDIIIECSDLQNVKYLCNDACVLMNKCLILGAALKYSGYVATFDHRFSDSEVHLRDLYPEEDPSLESCESAGVLNTSVGIIAMIQANEAIKTILNIGQSLQGYLLTYDALENRQMKVKIHKRYEGDIENLFETKSYDGLENLSQELEIASSEVLSYGIAEVNLLSNLSEGPDFQYPIHYLNSSDPNRFSPFIDKNKVNILCCASGVTSLRIVKKLKEAGLSEKIYSLKGGLNQISPG